MTTGDAAYLTASECKAKLDEMDADAHLDASRQLFANVQGLASDEGQLSDASPLSAQVSLQAAQIHALLGIGLLLSER